MERELVKIWCSENIYFLREISKIVNYAVQNDKERVQICFETRIVPIDPQIDPEYLSEVLQLLGYSAKVEVSNFMNKEVIIVEFGWEKETYAEPWIQNHLLKIKKENFINL